MSRLSGGGMERQPVVVLEKGPQWYTACSCPDVPIAPIRTHALVVVEMLGKGNAENGCGASCTKHDSMHQSARTSLLSETNADTPKVAPSCSLACPYNASNFGRNAFGLSQS